MLITVEHTYPNAFDTFFHFIFNLFLFPWGLWVSRVVHYTVWVCVRLLRTLGSRTSFRSLLSFLLLFLIYLGEKKRNKWAGFETRWILGEALTRDSDNGDSRSYGLYLFVTLCFVDCERLRPNTTVGNRNCDKVSFANYGVYVQKKSV